MLTLEADLKVLIVTPGKSGPLKNANLIAKGLAKRGDRVFVYLLDSPEYRLDFSGMLLDKPSRIVRPLGNYVRVIRALTLRKISFYPQVILTSYSFLIPFLKLVFPDVPIVYRMMGVPRTEFSKGVEKLAYAIETSTAKRYARQLVTVTTADHYARIVCREWKTEVPYIHNGVDTDFYKPLAEKKELKKALGFLKYDYVVTLGLTRFNEVYKPLTYLEWYLDALSHHKEKRLATLILGKTTTKQKRLLERFIENHTTRDQASRQIFRVEYTTSSHLLRKYYRASDLFVSFMRQSLMEKEALACGVPVITDFWEGENAIKELSILQHEQNKEKFEEIIETFLQDENLRREYSEKARKVAERDFSPDVMSDKYREALQQAIAIGSKKT